MEEAYRRKCIQLKARTAEVEDANDAARLRLTRLKRQVEKMRLERAFLLEQLARRTSTNVEDSDGSPSPPPTVRHISSPPTIQHADPQQPQERPLRTKRGHRKPSLLANLETVAAPGSTFINQNLQTLSPSSDAFSHTHADSQTQAKEPRANGDAKAPKRPSTAFELYCAEARPALKAKDGSVNVEEELARGWKDLPASQKEEFEATYERELAKYKKAKEEFAKAENQGERSQAEDTPAPDEDVEMKH